MAIECLAASAEPIQSRLDGAAIVTVSLNPKDFRVPAERARFSSIREQLTSQQDLAGDEGSFAASTSRLSDDQAIKLAKEIVSLFSLHASGLVEDAKADR